MSTSTRTEIGQARMTYLQGECSHRRADEEEEEEEEEEVFNDGRVVVLNTPPCQALDGGLARRTREAAPDVCHHKVPRHAAPLYLATGSLTTSCRPEIGV